MQPIRLMHFKKYSPALWLGFIAFAGVSLVMGFFVGTFLVEMLDKSLHPTKYANQFGPEFLFIFIVPLSLVWGLQMALFMTSLERRNALPFFLLGIVVPVEAIVVGNAFFPARSLGTLIGIVWVILIVLVSILTFGREGYAIYRYKRRAGAKFSPIPFFIMGAVVAVFLLQMLVGYISNTIGKNKEHSRLAHPGFTIYATPTEKVNTDHVRVQYSSSILYTESKLVTSRGPITVRQAALDNNLKKLVGTNGFCDYSQVVTYVQVDGLRVSKPPTGPPTGKCPIISKIGSFTLIRAVKTREVVTATPYIALTSNSITVFSESYSFKGTLSQAEQAITDYLRSVKPTSGVELSKR